MSYVVTVANVETGETETRVFEVPVYIIASDNSHGFRFPPLVEQNFEKFN